MTEPTPPEIPGQAQPSDDLQDAGKVEVWLELSSDKMEATLSGRAEPGADLRAVQLAVTNLLREHGIKHGLSVQEMRQAIEMLCQGKDISGLVIARGTPPEPGRDASIQMLVSLPGGQVGRQNAQGHVDFRDRGALPVIKPGTPIATLQAAQPGKPGRNVLGKDMAAPPARLLRLQKGRGVELEQNGTVAMATLKGILNRPSEERFEVLDVLEINGDVDFNVGHVNFPGLVRVKGAVLPDFRVRAHTLEVETLENRSRVEVTGDLRVAGGIMGCEILAGGRVSARYVRQSRIVCGGDCVVENEIVSSEVVSNGKVSISSGDGRMVNSQVAAIKGVSTNDLVCSGRGSMVVRLGVRPEFEQKLQNAKRQLTALAKEREHLQEVLVGQEQELSATEEELRGILASLNDPEQQANRDNFLTQVHMIKPLRDNLKEGVANGRTRLEDIAYEAQRLSEKMVEMQAFLPAGAVWLDVRGKAEAMSEIRTPRAALVLEQSSNSFSAREVEIKDKATGASTFAVKMGNLRSSA